MKKLLLSVVVCLTCGSGVFAQLGVWNPQATGFPNTSTGVFNISVVDSDIVWISSYDGTGGMANYQDYSMTIDGGSTWIPGVVPAPTNYGWSMIYGLDASTAWAMFYDAVAGSGGGIWKTSDGGVTWNQQGAGTIFNATSFPDVVYFWDANVGFSMGDPNPGFEIYTTTDGGTTWVPVPSANIPTPLAGEYGIVNHFEVVGNTVWFDTNKGRVYKSIDQGLNWTVSSTGITVPANGAIDIVFTDANNGLARLYNGTTGVNTAVRTTTDGGATWTPATVTGNMFGNDLQYVPGTTSRIVSTGAAAGFIGSSYSDDGGITWTDIETSAQRTALGVFNANTMWAGGFTIDPVTDGIFKFAPLVIVACGDPNLAAGVTSAPDSTICFGDTLMLETAGAFPPTAGGIFGWSMIVSTQDISNNPDPLNQPPGVILGGTGAVFPVGNPMGTTLFNTGVPFPAGSYYFTPVVYANASDPLATNNVANFVLDPGCTVTGTSVLVTLYAAGDPACNVGMHESANGVSFTAFQSAADQMSMNITSDKQKNLEVSLFDIAGRMVKSSQVTVNSGQNSQTMDINGLSAGTYIVRVSDGNGSATAKFFRY